MTTRQNESPGGAGLFVKTLSKYATDFIAFASRFGDANVTLPLLGVVLAIQAVLIVLGGL